MALLLAETKWQQSLFLRDEFSDCEIIVGTPHSSQRFPCHRAILSSACEVFAKMFQCECSENATGKIIINDINPSDMLSVLKYIYYGCIYIEDWKMAFGILKVAHKYNMHKLWKECENFLSQSLTLDNVCKFLELSILYNLTDLKCQCLELCSKGCFAIVRRNSFLKLNLDAMKEIFLMDSLNVESEMMVFRAAWERAALECCRKQIKVTDKNIADEFKTFIECIRFETMSDEEMNSLPEAVCLLPEVQSKIASGVEEAAVDSIEECKAKCVIKGVENQMPREAQKKREVEFPLGLSYHFTKFRMSVSPLCTSSTGSLLLKFSFSSYVYLHHITIVCFKDSSQGIVAPKNDACSNQPGFSFSFVGNSACPPPSFCFYRPKNLFLNISSKNKNMEVPCKKIHNSFICQKKFSADALGTERYTKVSKEVYKMKFEATRLLLFEADVEYMLEFCALANSNFKFVLTWPAVLPKCSTAGKVQLQLQSKDCYGLSKITVINAS